MKIAILISGHIRTWDKCKDNFINNLQDPNIEVNVFIHTYNEIFNCVNSNENNRKDSLSNEKIMDLFQGINVKKIKIESEKELHDSFISKYGKYTNCIFSPHVQGMKLKCVMNYEKSMKKKII